MTSLPLRRALAVPLLLALVTGLGACSGDDEPVDGSGGSAVELPQELRSSPADAFSLVEHDGRTYVVGHRLLVEVPAEWAQYGPEQPSPDGTSVEWAVGERADATPAPAGLQMSMAAQGRKGVIKHDPVEASTAIAELAPEYRLLDSGGVEVEGAQQARFLRLERQMQVQKKRVLVEQVSLFLRTGKDRWSTVRFIAPAGEWDEMMTETYDSVRVTTTS